MRINPLNFNYRPMFGQVKNSPSEASKEILGEKETIYDFISDKKGIDIWAFKRTSGGMFNSSTRYILKIKDQKRGDVISEIEDSAENLELINDKLEENIMRIDATNNSFVANALMASKVAEEHPEAARELAAKLIKSSVSNEAKTWEHRIKLI